MNLLLMDQFFQTLPSFDMKAWGEVLQAWDPLKFLKEAFDSSELGVIEIDIPEGVFIQNPSLVSIGKGTTIEPGVYIQGPCIIGKGCTIRQGAYLRPHSWIGEHCLVGHDTEVKHSILFDHAKAAHFAYLGDSIIGSGVNIGAGVICANFRFDHGEVPIYVDNQKIPTGLKKLGAIIADDVQVGCNTVLNPGTIIGRNSWINPTMNVSGYVPPNSFVKSPEKSFCITPKSHP